MSEEFLNSAKAWIVKYGGGVSLILIVVWPLATLPFGVFPKAIWNLWVAVAFMWGWAPPLSSSSSSRSGRTAPPSSRYPLANPL